MTNLGIFLKYGREHHGKKKLLPFLILFLKFTILSIFFRRNIKKLIFSVIQNKWVETICEPAMAQSCNCDSRMLWQSV